ncbi:MgtC/SapB family protein [Desulfofundulus sp. TPOSR]|uniref:MgtC/SapB family protein n=1 Tax=Desulfofundulus sp. TPOSR TaxID=2714340 RepID=UPI001407EE3F|nr:MgtC/SapB family protein [Desulfofundulus sp. TPOSR]NHM26242.1 MgtC/SapB family protein [Desulfofundulus sp. TPOSR]
MLSLQEMIARLLLAFLVGFFIGLEREIRHKPAGVRTHTLVCLGSALFTLISSYGFMSLLGTTPYQPGDPTRIAAQIVTGVGFIGGGIIFKDQDHIRGLTTAASIWLTAGLGTGIGAGLYVPSLVAAVLGYLTLKLNRLLRRWGLDDPGEE